MARFSTLRGQTSNTERFLVIQFLEQLRRHLKSEMFGCSYNVD